MPEEKNNSLDIREAASPKKPQLRTKKIGSRTSTRKKTTSLAEQRIDSGLASIYHSENGQLPDMKKIEIKKRHPVLGFIMATLIIGSVMAFAAWIGFFVLPSSNTLAENQLSLEVSGPKNVLLGATTTYTISYRNNQSEPVDNAVLTLWYPAGFIFATSSVPMNNGAHNEASLGTIAGKSTGTLSITGLSYGSLNQAGSLRLSLKYQPKNITSPLQKTADLITTVTESPYTVAIEAPATISAGSPTELTFIVKSTDNKPAPELRLAPILPSNFTLTTSTPQLTKDNRWIIKSSSTTPNQVPGTFSFKLRGTFSDEGASKLPITAELSIVAPSAQIFQIAATGVESTLVKTGALISLAANGSLEAQSISPGANLSYSIQVKNTSSAELKDVTVLLALDGPSYKNQSILKWSAIQDKFDGDIQGEQISETIRHGQISWTKKKIPALAALKAGQEVTIDIILPLKTSKDVDLKNFSETKITSLANLTYTDLSGAKKTSASNPLLVTINSDLAFETRETITTENDQEKHALTWVLTNSLHPLKNITLTATVFGDTASVSTTPAPAGTEKYDAATKKITWTIPQMPDSVDVLAWPFTITLDKKNPTQNTLVSKVTITAEDTVTGQTITLTGADVPLK